VISAVEIALLLSSSDGDMQAQALASLFESGLVSAIVNGDAVTAIRTTDKGNARLASMMLPTVNE
jgi:hypothetical protein